MSNANHAAFDKASKAGFIIALGIVYGDIGTSPLYTMQSLVENQGGLSSFSVTMHPVLEANYRYSIENVK